MSDETFDIREAWLEANANREFTSQEFAELVRLVLRGIESRNAGSVASDLLYKLKDVGQLVLRCGKFDEHQAIDDAIRSFSQDHNLDRIDAAYSEVSIAALRYLAERTAGDRCARARASHRKSELSDAIEYLSALRDEPERA